MVVSRFALLVLDTYHIQEYIKQETMMIKSFRSKEAERIFDGEVSRKLPRDIQDRALIKLRQLAVVLTLDDLINPPSNRFERLKVIGRVSIACGLTTSGESVFGLKMALLLKLR